MAVRAARAAPAAGILRTTFYSLQYVRAVAAALVVVHHIREQLPEMKLSLPSPFGAAGVDLFFVISGFIMVYVTRGRSSSGLEFLRRRVVRVVPLYWLFTTLLMALALAVPSVFRTVEASWPHYFASLGFIPVEVADRIRPLISIGWTLNYEMFFYVCFALALWLEERMRVVVLATAFALLCLARAVLPVDFAPLTFYGDPIIFEFVAGMAIAVVLPRVAIPAAACWGCLVAGLAIFGLVAFNVPADKYLRVLYFGVPAILVVIGVLGLEAGSSSIAPPTSWWQRLWLLLGDASYATYLSHIFTLGVVRALFSLTGLGLANPWLVLGFGVVAFLLSQLVGVTIHLTVEKPLTAWLSAYSARKSA